jgi:dihydropteroate synthase
MAADRLGLTIDCRGRPLAIGGETQFVGIVNATPDSFFDGGQFATAEAAAAQAVRLAAEGAAMIDLGGQSTRPGHEEISVAAEIDRVRPALERMAGLLSVPISIDTHRAETARAALAAGAHLVNDIHGFQGDPAMAQVVAEHGCPVILMHCDREFTATPGDALEKIKRFFARSLAIAAAAGVPAERIVLDPGIGFAKKSEESLEILGRLDELKILGFPLLVGASRKSAIGRVLGLPPEDRLEGTIAATVLAVWQGVELVRVHDVRANLRAARVAEAILAAKFKK